MGPRGEWSLPGYVAISKRRSRTHGSPPNARDQRPADRRVRCTAMSGVLAAFSHRRFVVAAELPDCLQQLVIVGIPQTATMKVGAKFADRRHELTGSHLGDDSGEFMQGG